ncbi:EpsG family protein [Clostridium folliculivorans]|uniref:EpsG family protein n=1 Tax=Clostridium folliculivorans TaxID=2886038 RepID=UPI0024897346|nr:hypothetical protein CFB3_37490 [Clostridium folliculivorans]
MNNSFSTYENSYKKDKLYNIRFGFIIIFIIMWILFAFNTGNADYDVYKMSYDSMSSFFNDVGYNSLALVFSYFGVSYQMFLAFFSLIGLLLIANTVFEFSQQPTKVFFLYCIFPFFFDIVQIRNFMAMAIVIYAIRYLIKFNNKNFIKYCLCILIASSFHTVALVYLIFLFVYIKDIKKLFKVSIILATCGSIGILASIQLIRKTIVGSILYSLNPKILYYLSDNLQSKTRTLYIIYITCMLIITFIEYKIYFKRSNNLMHVNDGETNKVLVLLKLCILSSVFIIFVILDPTMFRIYRNVIPYFYMLSTYITYDKSKRVNIVSILINISFYSFAILSFINFLIKDSMMYYIVTSPILNNNFLLQQMRNSLILTLFLLFYIVACIFIVYFFYIKKLKKL